MSPKGYYLRTMPEFIGRELGVSPWVTIDQERIDRFADCTGDRQWIHVDVERARRESPTGSTVAHGFLILALVARFSFDVGVFPPEATQVFNYGVEGARFLAPVTPGSRVRDRVLLLAVEAKGPGRWLVRTKHSFEIEGGEKPALVAESLAMMVTP